MRIRILSRLMGVVGIGACLFLPTLVEGQFRGGGGFPGGGGGFPQGGGMPGGGFRGPGGGIPGGGFPGGGMPGGAAGMMSDPSKMFDFLAKGRPYFLVTETRSLREPLMQFAQQRGITNGQITRDLFIQFQDQMKSTVGGGAAPAPGGFGPGGFGMIGPGMGRGNPLEAMGQFADAEFRRRDGNGDNFLNMDEMPDAVRQDLGRWDTNRDNLIDQSEYRGYFMARLGRGGDEPQANPVTIILEEELDTRPNVFRAGKMPREPRWLQELDTDRDGQVALHEWRKGGKNIDDFSTYDHNDDGFITAEEALRVYANRGNGNGGGDYSAMGERPSFMSREGGGDRPQFGKGAGGPGGFGGAGGFNREEFMKKLQGMPGAEEWMKKMKNGGGKKQRD